MIMALAFFDHTPAFFPIQTLISESGKGVCAHMIKEEVSMIGKDIERDFELFFFVSVHENVILCPSCKHILFLSYLDHLVFPRCPRTHHFQKNIFEFVPKVQIESGIGRGRGNTSV